MGEVGSLDFHFRDSLGRNPNKAIQAPQHKKAVHRLLGKLSQPSQPSQPSELIIINPLNCSSLVGWIFWTLAFWGQPLGFFESDPPTTTERAERPARRPSRRAWRGELVTAVWRDGRAAQEEEEALCRAEEDGNSTGGHLSRCPS